MRKIAGHPDILPGFAWFDIDVGDAIIRTAVGGGGPPLLLLHGHPQTHLTWHKIAPVLARRFTVVATDLRGYGDSTRPVGGPATRHAICEDYRAAAGIHLEHDTLDAERKIEMPLLAHSPQEECPGALVAALDDFL